MKKGRRERERESEGETTTAYSSRKFCRDDFASDIEFRPVSQSSRHCGRKSYSPATVVASAILPRTKANRCHPRRRHRHPAKYVIREARLKIPRATVSHKLALSPFVATCHFLDGLNDAARPRARCRRRFLHLPPASNLQTANSPPRSNVSKCPSENTVTFFVLYEQPIRLGSTPGSGARGRSR